MGGSAQQQPNVKQGGTYNPQQGNGLGGGVFNDPNGVPVGGPPSILGPGMQGQTGPNPGPGVNQGATQAHSGGPAGVGSLGTPMMAPMPTQPMNQNYGPYMASLPSQQQMQQGAQAAAKQGQQVAQSADSGQMFNPSIGGTGGFTAGVGGGSGKTPSGSFQVGPDGEMMMAGQLGGWGPRAGAPFGAPGGYGGGQGTSK